MLVKMKNSESITMKICFKCNSKKPLTEYYKHKGMSDGHLNKCKTCTKNDSNVREKELRKDPIWVEKEKKRSRDKYKRLGYKEKKKIWYKDKPWKQSSVYKGLSKKFKTPKGKELHHWNYNDEFLEDVFVLDISLHRSLHKFLTLNLEKRIFITDDGVELDTRQKHLLFIKKHIKLIH